MCIHCDVDPQILVEEILPGYILGQAKVSVDGWKAGDYAISRIGSNNPSIIFSGPILKDPTSHLSDKELSCLPKDSQVLIDFEAFCLAFDSLNKLKCYPEIGWNLINAAIEVGFCPEIMNFNYWLMNRMGEML